MDGRLVAGGTRPGEMARGGCLGPAMDVSKLMFELLRLSLTENYRFWFYSNKTH